MIRRGLASWWHQQGMLLFFNLLQLRRCFIAGEIMYLPASMFLSIFICFRFFSFPRWFEIRRGRIRSHQFILQAVLLCWLIPVLLLTENIPSVIEDELLTISVFFQLIWLLKLKIIARGTSFLIRYILTSTVGVHSLFSGKLVLLPNEWRFVLHPEFQIIYFCGISAAWLKSQVGDDWAVHAHSTIVFGIEI